MATVYLARDRKHDRPVALKVLRPDLSAALGPDRFRQEVTLATRLQHPHILSIYDSGVVDATDSAPALYWFAMPYVEGESLRARMERERQLPVDTALRIAHEAARALDHAHRHTSWSWCTVSLIRWSVTRPSGKLYVRIFSDRSPVPTWERREEASFCAASSCARCRSRARR